MSSARRANKADFMAARSPKTLVSAWPVSVPDRRRPSDGRIAGQVFCSLTSLSPRSCRSLCWTTCCPSSCRPPCPKAVRFLASSVFLSLRSTNCVRLVRVLDIHSQELVQCVKTSLLPTDRLTRGGRFSTRHVYSPSNLLARNFPRLQTNTKLST